MTINFEKIKLKILPYFKEELDQTAVMVILLITLINAFFVSTVFYLTVMSPSNKSTDSTSYKYIRIRTNQEVLNKLDEREETDQRVLQNIEEVRDIYK